MAGTARCACVVLSNLVKDLDAQIDPGNLRSRVADALKYVDDIVSMSRPLDDDGSRPQEPVGWTAVSERKPDDQVEVLMLRHSPDKEAGAAWTTDYELGWLDGDTWFANYRAGPMPAPHYWMDPPPPPAPHMSLDMPAKGDQT